MKRMTKTGASRQPITFDPKAYEEMLGKVEGFRITVEAVAAEGKVIGKSLVENISTLHRVSASGTETLFTTGKVSILGQAQQFALNMYAIGSKAAAQAATNKAARAAAAAADRD